MGRFFFCFLWYEDLVLFIVVVFVVGVCVCVCVCVCVFAGGSKQELVHVKLLWCFPQLGQLNLQWYEWTLT